MTTITFFTHGAHIKAIEMSGHAYRSPSGSDIVCAALTSAVRLVEAGLNDVLDVGAKAEIFPERTRVKITLPENIAADKALACGTLVQAFREHAGHLKQEYPGYIDIKEVDYDA